jgi:hypothetical protein
MFESVGGGHSSDAIRTTGVVFLYLSCAASYHAIGLCFCALHLQARNVLRQWYPGRLDGGLLFQSTVPSNCAAQILAFPAIMAHPIGPVLIVGCRHAGMLHTGATAEHRIFERNFWSRSVRYINTRKDNALLGISSDIEVADNVEEPATILR